jgi:hypothetical protein
MYVRGFFRLKDQEGHRQNQTRVLRYSEKPVSIISRIRIFGVPQDRRQMRLLW